MFLFGVYLTYQEEEELIVGDLRAFLLSYYFRNGEIKNTGLIHCFYPYGPYLLGYYLYIRRHNLSLAESTMTHFRHGGIK